MKRILAATSFIAVFASGAPHASAADSTAQGTTLSQESPDQWRSSKLVGVPIYGPDNKSVGKITDMLMGKDGKVTFVVIGVGGFLGIGEKDVAVPFDAVAFSDKPMSRPGTSADDMTGAMTSATATGPAPASGGMSAGAGAAPAPTVGPGSRNDAPANGMAPMGGMATDAPAARASTTYPDHGMIAMNKDQLKDAPSFQFAR